jgi:hypothetical protein
MNSLKKKIIKRFKKQFSIGYLRTKEHLKMYMSRTNQSLASTTMYQI